MRLALPQFIMRLVELAYERVFHDKMTDDAKSFVAKLSYVGAGTGVAVLFSFIFNILAGRILGPDGYGEFTLIQSVAMFLCFPMTLGLTTAMVKYSAEKEDFKRQSTVISSTYILIIILIIASLILYFIFSSPLSKIFSIPERFFYLTIILAMLYSFYVLTTGTLKGLHKMGTYAVFQPMYAAILLFAFLLFVLGHFLSSKSAIFSLFLAYGITGIVLQVFFLRKYVRFKIDWSWAKILIKYSLFAALGGLSSLAYSYTDRILINRYMTVADVGIFGAYFMASIYAMEVIFEAFNIVFFPTASKYKDKKTIFNAVNRLTPYIIGIGVPLALICEFIVLKIYGAQYPFNPVWFVLFGVTAICAVVSHIYSWLLNSVGTQGVKITSISAVIQALTNVGLNIWLIPLIGITGAVVSTAAALLVNTALILVFGKKYLIGEVQRQL